MAKKKTVVIGFLGTVLDGHGKGSKRWERWRPSVDLCRHDDLQVDRFELLSSQKHYRTAKRVCGDIAEVSPKTTVKVHDAHCDDPWDFVEVYSMLFEFARNYPFDLTKEDYLIHLTTGTHVAQICLFLLTETRYLPGKLLQTGPGRDEGARSPGQWSTIDLDLSKYDQLAKRFKQEHRDDVSLLKSGIQTKNGAFNALIDEVETVAVNSRQPILLSGPTGAGKSQLARQIYTLKQLRQRIPGDFVSVNCATLRGDTAMATLFGHVKGSFTGATTDRPGLLRTADKGLLFLDEVGELGLDEQAMLLQAIEEKRFLPVGADTSVESDFQLICGTNRDLRVAVGEGRFREDLLARINLWSFTLPGLRDRKEDLAPNLDFEVEKNVQRRGTHVQFNKEARAKFLKFAMGPEGKWTGNFRDLGAAVTRMVTLATGGRITVREVEREIARLNQDWQGTKQDPGRDVLALVLSSDAIADIDPFDRVQLAEVVRVCRESRSLSEAGRILFAVSREKRKSTNDADRLGKYLAKFGLSWAQVTEG